jgi:uncharacterized DUF497 family protein
MLYYRITVRFAWDPDKHRTNQKKHGITFETATRVFDDSHVIFRQDRIVEGQLRWHAIGRAEKAVLVVVHAYLEVKHGEEENVRIISAREASKRERRIYMEQTAE